MAFYLILDAEKKVLAPGSTITSLIKCVNEYKLTPDQMTVALERFKLLNPQETFRPGDEVYVPNLLKELS